MAFQPKIEVELLPEPPPEFPMKENSESWPWLPRRLRRAAGFEALLCPFIRAVNKALLEPRELDKP
jgi:hypothetical protein